MSLLSVARRAWEVLPPESRQRAWALGAVACLNGVAEVSGVAGILPMVVLAGDPQAVESHPWLSRAYQALGFQSPQAFLIFLGTGFLALFVLVNLTRALCAWMGLRFSFDVSHRLSVRLLRDSLGRPYVWLLGRNGNDLARRLLHEVDGVVANVYRPLTEVVTNGVAAAMVAAGLMALDPVVAAVAGLGLAGLFTVIYRVSRENLARLGELRSELDSARSRTVHEGLSAVKESRLLSRRAGIASLYEDQSRRYQGARVAAELVGELPRYLTEILAIASLVSALIFFSLSGRGAVAWMMVCVMATWRLVPALQTLYRNAARVRFFAPVLEDLARDLAAAVPALPESPAPLPLASSVRLDDVRFAYPGTRDGALHGVTLEIPAGSRVALVGETGAGKTTVADLVAGALTPDRGRVEVDGAALDEGRLPGWHRNVGYVPQEIFLADDTVARNIALGLPDALVDRLAVERAARAACIHDFVVGELPHGYDTRLGERGVSLSGGQRQRIGIARALYERPQLLILDEATSSLDGLTQRRVLEGLHEACEGLTVLVIAHRLEVVKECDRLYLLDGGRVTAQGTFAELLRTSPRFQAMAEKVS